VHKYTYLCVCVCIERLLVAAAARWHWTSSTLLRFAPRLSYMQIHIMFINRWYMCTYVYESILAYLCICMSIEWLLVAATAHWDWRSSNAAALSTAPVMYAYIYILHVHIHHTYTYMIYINTYINTCIYVHICTFCVYWMPLGTTWNCSLVAVAARWSWLLQPLGTCFIYSSLVAVAARCSLLLQPLGTCTAAYWLLQLVEVDCCSHKTNWNI